MSKINKNIIIIIHELYMDNNLTDDQIEKTHENIKKLYKNDGFFSKYGTDIILCIIVFIITFVIYTYFKLKKDFQPIKNNWPAERCKPTVIPIAGFINKPDNMSIIDFTQQNFTYCMQDILKNVSGESLKPLTYITSTITLLYNKIGSALNSARNIAANVRGYLTNITENINNRILNVVVPLMSMLVAFKDMGNKVTGILTAGIYTSLSTYYALKSFLGALVKIIIGILVAAVAAIISLWMVPVTWPIAVSGTALFIVISVTMSIFLVFLTKVLHIKTGLKIPKAPKKPKICFDKNTPIKMNDGTIKSISDVQVGDELLTNTKDKNIVTAKFILHAKNSKMYMLGNDNDNIIVSGSHQVKHEGKWIYVKDHPCKKLVKDYKEPIIYCLNTTSKEIVVNDYIFTDWDEITEETYDILNKYLNTYDANYKNKNLEKSEIHKVFNGGFQQDTFVNLINHKISKIKSIKLGDTLERGEKVYGIVQILDETNLDSNKSQNHASNKLFHLLTDQKYFHIGSTKINDYNHLIDKYLFSS